MYAISSPVIISPLHNKQDNTSTSFVSIFCQFKDILNLEYRVLYFSTHIEIVTNIATAPCLLAVRLNIKFVRGRTAEKVKSTLCGL